MSKRRFNLSPEVEARRIQTLESYKRREREKLGLPPDATDDDVAVTRILNVMDNLQARFPDDERTRWQKFKDWWNGGPE